MRNTLTRIIDLGVRRIRRQGGGLLGRGGTPWPIEHEVRVIGIGAHTMDRPHPHGFPVSCPPVKIEGASAGWRRAVAIVS